MSPDDPSHDDDAPRDEGVADETDTETPSSDAAQALEKKLDTIGTAALVTVTMAVRAALARGEEGSLSDEQRAELAEVRKKLVKSLHALDEQSERGDLADVDLGGLRDKILRSIEELDEHLLPDHPGQQSGAHEVLPS